MPLDPRFGTDREKDLAFEMHRAWLNGTPKSDLEVRFLGTNRAHGKRFSGLIRKHLGIETERQHPLAAENERLRQLLKRHGINPDGG
jgi:hypothetical protein